MTRRNAREAGDHRTLYCALEDDAAFRALSSLAQRVLYALKLRLPRVGIGPLDMGRLVGTCGSDVTLARFRAALDELAGSGFVRWSGPIVWLVNGLRFEPYYRADDARHRLAVQRALLAFARNPVAQEFRAHYPAFFPPTLEVAEAGQPPDIREGCPGVVTVTNAGQPPAKREGCPEVVTGTTALHEPQTSARQRSRYPMFMHDDAPRAELEGCPGVVTTADDGQPVAASRVASRSCNAVPTTTTARNNMSSAEEAATAARLVNAPWMRYATAGAHVTSVLQAWATTPDRVDALNALTETLTTQGVRVASVSAYLAEVAQWLEGGRAFTADPKALHLALVDYVANAPEPNLRRFRNYIASACERRAARPAGATVRAPVEPLGGAQ